MRYHNRFNELRFVQALLAILIAGSQAAPACAALGDDNKQTGKSFSGNVSWYGTNFNGKKTASGEPFDMSKLTSAHLTLPFQTKVLVEDPRTGQSVIVKINDRGPYVRTRVMDLSREAARQLGTLSRGIAYVDCLVVTDSQSN